jgi:hypothetical protein
MSDSLTEQQVAELPVHLEDDQVEEGAAPTSARAGLFRFARMTGSSIAGHNAAGWVTDFFNAAYYRRSVRERDVDGLRLAFCVLTTYGYRNLLRRSQRRRAGRARSCPRRAATPCAGPARHAAPRAVTRSAVRARSADRTAELHRVPPVPRLAPVRRCDTPGRSHAFGRPIARGRAEAARRAG